MRLLVLLAALVLTPLLPAVLSAAPVPQMELTVDADFEPAQAVGFVFDTKGTLVKNDAKFTKLAEKRFLVTFALSAEELKSGASASAMLLDAAGKSAFADVRAIDKEGHRPAALGLSLCKEQSNIPTTVQGQIALLESLVSVRSQRREVLQNSINSELSGEQFERLQRLEEGFGLKQQVQIGPELPPYQLVERLSAVLTAVKNVRVNKARRDAELRQTIAAPPQPQADAPAE